MRLRLPQLYSMALLSTDMMTVRYADEAAAPEGERASDAHQARWRSIPITALMNTAAMPTGIAIFQPMFMSWS